jgi:SIR2-like domain
MSGHVFVLRGDLTQLACDAWLLPTDFARWVEPYWLESLSPECLNCIKHAVSQEWPDSARTMPVSGVDGPQPWLVMMGHNTGTVDWFFDGVDEFVERVAVSFKGTPPRNGRSRHLAALPLVGTGKGGGASRKGEVARGLLPRLIQAAERHFVDLALVAFDDSSLTAAQRARELMIAQVRSELTPSLREALGRLGGCARNGSLVLFLGAGVSQGAGLPGWKALLNELASSLGFDSVELERLGKLNHLDCATILERRALLQGAGLGHRAAERIKATNHYSLSHGLLACLPVQAMVTQNYDDLLEKASEGAGQPVAVLPYQPCDEADRRWLLKMHGCVHHPEDIVLRREDFLRYGGTRAALRGIVQTLLITRTMLFVGFSLEDPNFLQVVDDVRQAVHADAGSAGMFGTALFLKPEPLLEEVWQGDLQLLAVGDDKLDFSEAARQLEIFLDLLLAEGTSNTAHLMDNTFLNMLTEGEKEVRSELLELRKRLGPEARNTEAWQMVEQLMVRLGAKPAPKKHRWEDVISGL